MNPSDTRLDQFRIGACGWIFGSESARAILRCLQEARERTGRTRVASSRRCVAALRACDAWTRDAHSTGRRGDGRAIRAHWCRRRALSRFQPGGEPVQSVASSRRAHTSDRPIRARTCSRTRFDRPPTQSRERLATALARRPENAARIRAIQRIWILELTVSHCVSAADDGAAITSVALTRGDRSPPQAM